MPVACVDAKGVLTVWAEAARRLLGYRPDEIVGRDAADLLAGDLPSSAQRSLAEGEECRGKVALRHRSGHLVEVDLQAFPAHGAHGNSEWMVVATGPDRPGPDDDVAVTLKEWEFDQLPVSHAIFDTERRLIAASAEALRLLGMPENRVVARRMGEVRSFPPEHDELEQLLARVLRTGEPIKQEVVTRAPGEPRLFAWSVFCYPLKDPSGQVRGVSLAGFDISEQYRARQRLTIVNEASVRIGSTLDVVRTAQELAGVAAERFADFVSVDLLEPVLRGKESDLSPPPGAVRFCRAAQRSVLDGSPESVVEPGQTDVYPRDSPMARALASGVPSRHSLDEPDVQQWLAHDPARARSLHRHGVHSLIAVPLLARGTTLGLAVYLRHRTPEPYDSDDLLLAEEITARAAVCVDNARRYTHQRNTALALQRSLLPQHPPHEAAVEVASRYLPAGSKAGVGGDWFDVIPLSGARVALVVGDVVGHGIQASATMGRLRTAVRTLADVDVPPDELLTHLDDLVLRLDREEGPQTGEQPARNAGDIGATCLYAVYDPVSRRCTFARAGHPVPALVSPNGTVHFPDLPAGPPLGLGGLPFESAEIELPVGSLIALYTDGLIESADRDVDAGLQLLRHALAEPGRSLEQLCDTVLGTLLPPGTPADDVALLIARTHALDVSQVATWDLTMDPAEVAQVRRLATDQLTVWGLEEESFVTELVVSELVTNAIRYARPPIQLRLIHDTSLICEVSDASNTSPHLRRARTFDEGGRGLLLVAQLTDRWGTRHTPAGKTIWTEQSLPARGK
ncbi:MAG: hypothetical protein JWP55_4065 [Mycobacterium sp.]|nr:hypothetical protein [Mycobacterium sp.]